MQKDLVASSFKHYLYDADELLLISISSTTGLRPTFCKIQSKDKYQLFDYFDRRSTEELPYNFQTTPPVSNTEEIMKGTGNHMQNFKLHACGI